ncbi:hypothetical protein L211DRAFT_214219 [Terfezia boudieri ATCC MYA-4762]|uniref:Uncharacterized protein n=1 Tax=Terfezia boudieri ATCC MYA-4762 TaxID=1051890 RepID=A0A3N4LRM7_9PEZI|nr:hypothetical protein L211DRAFT_214219 [Terfezia boudieri ATCC MYA-4762]
MVAVGELIADYTMNSHSSHIIIHHPSPPATRRDPHPGGPSFGSPYQHTLPHRAPVVSHPIPTPWPVWSNFLTTATLDLAQIPHLIAYYSPAALVLFQGTLTTPPEKKKEIRKPEEKKKTRFVTNPRYPLLIKSRAWEPYTMEDEDFFLHFHLPYLILSIYLRVSFIFSFTYIQIYMYDVFVPSSSPSTARFLTLILHHLFICSFVHSVHLLICSSIFCYLALLSFCDYIN